MVTNINNTENYIIVKPGYTYNICDRIDSLYNDYEIKCFPIRLVEINGQKNEIELHKYLKKSYSNLLYKLKEHKKKKMDGSSLTEFYYGTESLLNAFDTYSKSIILSNKIQIEKEKTKQKQLDHECEEVRLKQEEERTKQEEERTKQEEERTKQLKLEKETEMFILKNFGPEKYMEYLKIIKK